MTPRPPVRVVRMVETVLNHGAVGGASSVSDTYIKAYRLMLLARVLDDKLASLYRMGKIHGGVFLGRGQEALSVALGLALRKGDVFAPLIRDAAGRPLTRGHIGIAAVVEGQRKELIVLLVEAVEPDQQVVLRDLGAEGRLGTAVLRPAFVDRDDRIVGSALEIGGVVVIER